jgi:hypothetical protein
MRELWAPIPEWEGYYEASDQGRVRSVDRTIRKRSRSGGVEFRRCAGRVLTQMTSPNGYRKVSLTRPDLRTQRFIHDLVLTAFVGPAPAGMQCRHLDDVKTNNALGNLRWGTAAENGQDSSRNGRHPRGERHPQAVLTEADVRFIRRSRAQLADLADRFGVTPTTVWAARRGRNWRHVVEVNE